jgi:hypothetical protein
MKPVRFISTILFYISRIATLVVTAIAVYALAIIFLYANGVHAVPMEVSGNTFTIFLPFSRIPFLLGDYTASYLVSNLTTVAFYAIFLWLLGDVFHAFRQPKLFTRRGVGQLSRFYKTNLLMPFVFLSFLILFGHEFIDLLRIILLHLVIGVFAFFMAAIFRQGVLLQEEQDLTF